MALFTKIRNTKIIMSAERQNFDPSEDDLWRAPLDTEGFSVLFAREDLVQDKKTGELMYVLYCYPKHHGLITYNSRLVFSFTSASFYYEDDKSFWSEAMMIFLLENGLKEIQIELRPFLARRIQAIRDHLSTNTQ